MSIEKWPRPEEGTQPDTQPDMSQFSTDEMERLGYLAHDYATKNTTEQREVAEEYNRLDFVRWCVQQGIINENL